MNSLAVISFAFAALLSMITSSAASEENARRAFVRSYSP
jgi:hypothetical protein